MTLKDTIMNPKHLKIGQWSLKFLWCLGEVGDRYTIISISPN